MLMWTYFLEKVMILVNKLSIKPANTPAPHHKMDEQASSN